MDFEAPKKLSRRKFLLGAAAGVIGASFAPSLTLECPQALAYEPFAPFRFAYITDVHLTNLEPDSYELMHESQLFLQQLVKELNQEKVDFVMFGGDQVQSIGKDETNWQLFLDIVQGLTMPWAFVLGEADISGTASVDKIKTFGPDWKSEGIQTETPYWSHKLAQTPNVHLIGLDTSLPNTSVGGMSRRQLDWLKSDLADNKRFFTIIFCHHPLLPPPPYDGGPPWDDYVIPDGGAVREIIGGFPNVKLVISGHLHICKVQQENSVWHISSPSLVVYPCAYRIFNVEPDAVTMETRVIQFPALVKKAKKELIGSSIADRYSRSNPASFLEVVEGAREDQDAILPMVAGKSLQQYTPKKQKPQPQPKQDKGERHSRQKETSEPGQATGKSKRHSKHQAAEQAGEQSQPTKSDGGSDKPGKGHGRHKGKNVPREATPTKDAPAPTKEAPAAPTAEPDDKAVTDPTKIIDELIAPGSKPAEGTGTK